MALTDRNIESLTWFSETKRFMRVAEEERMKRGTTRKWKEGATIATYLAKKEMMGTLGDS